MERDTGTTASYPGKRPLDRAMIIDRSQRRIGATDRCCSAFRAKADAFPNLTLKKIPKAVTRECEWGHDDYSLEVEDLSKALPVLEEQTEDVPANPRRKFGKAKTAQATLFDVGDDQ